MTNRSIGTALLVAALLMPVSSASAQQAKCLASKTGCMAKKGFGFLKCERLAETPGKPADPNANDCITNVQAAFDGGSDPTSGCFEKLESKDPNDCITFDDTVAASTAVDTCVSSLVTAIDPPPLDQTKCGAGKKKCVAKYLNALLKCHKAAQSPGKPTDPNTNGCIDKAEAKYTGGADPTKGCFAKLEGKEPDDCQFLNDSPALQSLVEDCVADLVDLVDSPTTSTSTSTTTSTTVTTTTSTTTTTLDGPVCIGDRAWFDSVANGIQDSFEPGLSGVAFLLRTSGGALVSVDVSDPAGAYSFNDVPAGNYYIEVAPPSGYALTLLDQGSDDTLDNDFDPGSLSSPVFSFPGNGCIGHIDGGFVPSP